jgi:hypothetical protein
VTVALRKMVPVAPLENKKPSAVSVQLYWSYLKEPLDAMSALPTLYMIRRAMLDWPKMGVAIAQLALKEFKMEKAAKKLKVVKIEKAAKRALKEFALHVTNVCNKKKLARGQRHPARGVP